MKKIFSLVLVALFVCGIAFARDAGYPSRGDVFLQTATITNNNGNDVGHTHVTTSPSYVYRVTITASAANTYVQMFDSNGTWGQASTSALISTKGTATVGGNKFIKADLGAATANQSYNYEFNPPIKFEQGILAGIAGAGDAKGIDPLAVNTAVTATIHYNSEG